jgi:nucleotide-binding universal stress UspA family protein
MSREKRQLLVGDTLGPASDQVVAVAAAIAQRMHAGLHLLHGFQMPPAYFMAPSAMEAVYAGLLEVEERNRNQRLDEQLERLAIRDPASRTVAAGVAHRLLSERAAEIPADLIVVGAHDDAESHGFGSVADRVLRKASCPVLVVRGDGVLRPVRVLAPVDLSPACGDSLEQALELLDAVAGRHRPAVTALLVLTPGTPDPDGGREEAERRVHDQLERWIGGLDLGRGRCEARIRTGDPRREILRQIEVEPPELVIVGSHGRSGFERFLLGSVSEAVVRQAPTSVLVVPPGEAAEG